MRPLAFFIVTLLLHLTGHASDEAISVLENQYGLTVAEIHPLVSYWDKNFYIKTSLDEEYVLKISNPNQSYSRLECENEFIGHLNIDNAIAPMIIPNLDGNSIIVTPSGRWARLLEFLPGKTLRDLPTHSDELFFNFGVFIANIHHKTEHFDHPAAHIDDEWDLDNCIETIGARLKYIVEDHHRQQVRNHLDAFTSSGIPEMLANTSQFEHAVIHSDLNEMNILVDGDGSDLAHFRVIDFGDTMYSTRINDLAIAVAYSMLLPAAQTSPETPLHIANQITAGYHSIIPLCNDEWSVVVPLALMRVCTSVACSSYYQRLDPENTYISKSQKPAWKLFSLLEESSR